MNRSIALILFVSLITIPAFACRYNVRDVGFVAFDSSPYYLFLYVNDDTPDEIVTQFKQISYAALLDSNVRSEAVDVDRQSNHAALEYLPHDDNRTFPRAVLLASSGRTLELSLPTSVSEFKEALWNVLDAITTSPIRETVADDCINTFGVALMVESRDPEANQRVEKGIKSTIEKITNNMDLLPKAIDRPPQFVKITEDRFSEEKVLLWSLGIDTANLEEPAAAVIYGRGRKIGPLLQGEAAIALELYNTIAVIGLSCECGLDRKWMMGTMFPFRWNDTYIKQMAKNLGFDPENPLVKTEISQIVAYTGPPKQSSGAASTAYSDPLLGYSEVTIGAEPASDELISQETGPDLEALIAANLAATPTPVATPVIDPVIPQNQSSLTISYAVLAFFALVIAMAGFTVIFQAKGKKI